MTQAELQRALDLALEAAAAAVPGILASFRSPALRVERKPDGSVVTSADRAAEAEIRARLRASREFGGFQVLGEEAGLEETPSPYRWIIDPIDGTQSFTRGIPTFGTLIALEEAATGRALLGVIRLPALGDIFAGARGLGVKWNGNPVRCSGARDLRRALISTGDSRQFRKQGRDGDHARLWEACDHVRGYNDCWAHTLVIRGAVDALVEPNLAAWDIRATQVLVEEAGGKQITRLDAESGKYDTILGSAPLVDEIAALLEW